jgi:hypothetical protein
MRSAGALLAVLLLALPAGARPERQIIGVEQDHSIAQVGDCDDFFKTVFTAFPASSMEQEQKNLPMTGIDTLKVTATHEGGVSIRGWNRSTAKLIICRTAVAQTKAHADRVLDWIKVAHANGEISAHGPAIDAKAAWWVNFILYVPRRATVEVRSANGGVAIRNMDGNVTAHATRGGISVAQGSGSYKISTDSGGITLDRLSGRVDASSRDGAIAFKAVPNETLPVIEAKTEESGEILCHLERCENGLGSWTADRKSLKIGGATPSVKLSTEGADIIIDRVR